MLREGTELSFVLPKKKGRKEVVTAQWYLVYWGWAMLDVMEGRGCQ